MSSQRLERRLGRLEAAAAGGDSRRLLRMLLEAAESGVAELLRDGEDLVRVVDLATCDPDEPFAAEALRGIYPDKVLAAVYNRRRNFSYPTEIARRVRQLAGLYDGKGNLRPEYRETETGSIVDRDEPDWAAGGR